ncbi:hypothetical protein [Thiolapillus sp.]
MSKKAVIVLLVLCALLFVLALGSNWLPSAQVREERFNPESVKWLNKIDEWSGSFEKKVSLSRLKASNCDESQDEKGRYLLARGSECTIRIVEQKPPEDGHRILLVNAGKSVVFRVPKASRMPCPDKTQSRGLNPGVLMNPGVARIKTVPAVRLPAKVVNVPVLREVGLTFSPDGGVDQPDNKSTCLQKPPVKLAVFSAGGVLRMHCLNCSGNQKVEVVIE